MQNKYTKKLNLSKLIESMGEEFFMLLRNEEGYAAEGYSKKKKMTIRRLGETPKEAVAKLRDALLEEFILTNVK